MLMSHQIARRSWLVILGLAFSMTGCIPFDQDGSPTVAAPASTPKASSPIASLDISLPPLDIPTVSVEDTCPVAKGKSVSPDFGLAIGDGPVYAAGFGSIAVVTLARARLEGDWYYIKVLWISDPEYEGPIAIRGRQADGAHDVRFGEGADPDPILRLTAPGGSTPSGWNNWPTYTRLQAPGCYAFQVDGPNFTAIIFFEAKP